MDPLIKLDPNGKAPILSYNVPEPTSYTGRNFIELDFDATFFKDSVKQPPTTDSRAPIPEAGSALEAAVAEAMKSGLANTKLFPNIRTLGSALRLVGKPNPGLQILGEPSVSAKLASLDADEVTSQLRAHRRLNVYKSLSGKLTYNYVPEPAVPDPKLYLIETYRLSSFLGSYGAGRVLKTFTLLPGEKTKISMKTYTKTETDAKSASSVLDSLTEESANDFESTLQEEQSDKSSYEKTFEYHAEAEASASWGWGNAKVSGGVKGSSNRCREEFSKNVSNATQKHASKASAQRDVQVNTSYEVKAETGEETSIERELENINLSRTLNLVFRQMNQQFITVLHLVDVRVAFFNGYAESRREAALSQLDDLLDEVVEDSQAKRDKIRDAITAELVNVFDYQDNCHSVIEERTLLDAEGNRIGDRYWRFRRDIVSRYMDPVTGFQTDVPGVILSATVSVVRTEGVIVESLLGQGIALDEYAKELQRFEVQRRDAEVAKLVAENERIALGNQVLRDNDKERSAILVDLTYGPDHVSAEAKP